MINIGMRGHLYALGAILVNVSGLLAVIMTAVRLSADSKADVFYSAIYPSLSRAYPFLAVVFLVSYLVGYLLKGFNYNKWTLEVIQKALDDIQEDIFKRENHAHENRVTLFRWKRFCWRVWHNGKLANPWKGWLKPFLRSGHTGKSSSTIFVASTGTGENEGIAGKCWSMRTTLCVDRYKAFEDSDAFISDYANDTNTSVKFLRERLKEKRHFALSYLAIPIEIKGKVWGVIVVDSVLPAAIKSTQQTKYHLPVSLISKLIERLS